MGKIAISETVLDDAMLLREKGFTLEKVSKMLNIGLSTLSRAQSAYNAAKDGNVAQLKQIATSGSAAPVIWACKKFNLDFDVIVLGKEPKKDATKSKQDADNTCEAFLALMDGIKRQTEAIKELTTAVNAIDKRLSAMQLTQSGFRGDMTEKIKGVVDAININGDIATKENAKNNLLLDRIAQNTKRIPWPEGGGRQS